MTTERVIRIVAGSFVLLSLALGVDGSPAFVSHWFLAFTAFVGANLFQSGFTRFCPLELILKRAGVRSSEDAARAASSEDAARAASSEDAARAARGLAS